MHLTPSSYVTAARMVIVTERSRGRGSSPMVGTSSGPTIFSRWRRWKMRKFSGMFRALLWRPLLSHCTVFDSFGLPLFVALAFFLGLGSFSTFLLTLSSAFFLLHNAFNRRYSISLVVGIGIDNSRGVLSANKALEFVLILEWSI